MTRDLPSVTQVLGLFADFSRIPEATLAAAAERGTRVHAACAMLAQGLWMPYQEPEIALYVESFGVWMDQAVDEVLDVELKVTDYANGYCGHLDLAVIMRGDTLPSIIDLKTPVTKNRLWSAQLAAYRHAYQVQTGSIVSRVASLRLKKDEGPAIFDEYHESARDFAAFLAALNAYRWFNQG